MGHDPLSICADWFYRQLAGSAGAILPRVADMNAPVWLVRLRELVGTEYGRISRVARDAGMKHRSQLQKTLDGKNPNIQINTLERIANACGVPLEALFTRPGDGTGHVQKDEVGSTLLDRAVRNAKAGTGTWQADVVEAVTALARALGRASDSEQGPTGTDDTGR